MCTDRAGPGAPTPAPLVSTRSLRDLLNQGMTGGAAQSWGQVFATSVSTSYVATGSPSAFVTTASQRTSP